MSDRVIDVLNDLVETSINGKKGLGQLPTTRRIQS